MEVFRYTVISSARSDSFTTSFPIIPLIDFLCLVRLAEVSITTLNSSRNGGPLYIVPDLSGRSIISLYLQIR